MLSRVAETIYWMARYMERAEDMTRILAVNFLAQLDAPHVDADLAWHPIVSITGEWPLFSKEYIYTNAESVTDFFVWNPHNTNAVVTCIQRARENARVVREQITVEMWEHINRLYLYARDVDKAEVLASPIGFFRSIRDGSQSFEGIAHATMTHGEAFEFMELGKYHERASQTLRILNVKFATAQVLADGSPEATLQLIAMLKSCSAFEPFRRAHAAQIQASRVAEFLLLNREFPRAVAFCVRGCQQALQNLSMNATRTSAAQGALRTVGRMVSDLEYVDILELLRDDLHGWLIGLLGRLDQVGQEITHSFFNTQVILTDARGQQAQQQQ